MKLLFYLIIIAIVYTLYIKYRKAQAATAKEDNAAIPKAAPKYPYLKKVQGGNFNAIPEMGGITGYDSTTLNGILKNRR